MVLSNVIVDVTIPHRSFVFGQSQAKVSAGFTNVSIWKSQHSILYTAPCLSYGLSLSLSLVSSRRKVVIRLLTNQINNQSKIPPTDVIQLTLTLKMTGCRNVTVIVNNSPI